MESLKWMTRTQTIASVRRQNGIMGFVPGFDSTIETPMFTGGTGNDTNCKRACPLCSNIDREREQNTFSSGRFTLFAFVQWWRGNVGKISMGRHHDGYTTDRVASKPWSPIHFGIPTHIG